MVRRCGREGWLGGGNIDAKVAATWVELEDSVIVERQRCVGLGLGICVNNRNIDHL